MEPTIFSLWLYETFAAFDHAVLGAVHTLQQSPAGVVLDPLARLMGALGAGGVGLILLGLLLLALRPTRRVGLAVAAMGWSRLALVVHYPTDVAAGALIGLAAGFIVGACLQRFGSKGGWILWCVWMAICFAPQLLPLDDLSLPLPPDFLLYVAVVLAAVMLIWSVWSLLHAVVKH